ncbi:hypothetical protein ACO0LB_13655 [Undibacterium sp. SXout7W]|uniref:hypothetical protein n=1 Tax=Undibacterium sp. SXout7W TaxID=3413049 RepID=UPI003BF16B92
MAHPTEVRTLRLLKAVVACFEAALFGHAVECALGVACSCAEVAADGHVADADGEAAADVVVLALVGAGVLQAFYVEVAAVGTVVGTASAGADAGVVAVAGALFCGTVGGGLEEDGVGVVRVEHPTGCSTLAKSY